MFLFILKQQKNTQALSQKKDNDVYVILICVCDATWRRLRSLFEDLISFSLILTSNQLYV